MRGYRGYSKIRTRTGPRKVICSYAETCRRVLGRCVSLISSNPCTVERAHESWTGLRPNARGNGSNCGYLGSQGTYGKYTYEASVDLLWTPHDFVSSCALRAQIPTRQWLQRLPSHCRWENRSRGIKGHSPLMTPAILHCEASIGTGPLRART